MMAAKSYYIAAQIEESFLRLDNFRKSGETCDIRLSVSNKEIWAHKAVLASGSEYFKGAFYGSIYFGEPVYEIKNVMEYEILCELVNFIYTGKIYIDSENVCDIYKAVDFLDINLLKKPCLDFMEDIIDVDNCVEIWVIANTYNHEKLLTAAVKYIFANLEIVSEKIEFLNLSNEEILDFFERWPKHELYDSFITCVIKWTTNKENWEETVLKILYDIPKEKISTGCINYILKTLALINPYWPVMLERLILAIFKMETICSAMYSLCVANKEYSDFISKEPIVFITRPINGIHKFHKYDCQSREFNLYNTKKFKDHSAEDFISYKDYIYALRNKSSVRFPYDDLNEHGYESAFHHEHDKEFGTAILNDLMFLIGGVSSMGKGSIVDLNTHKITSFSLLHERTKACVAVNNGSIYICGGSHKDMIERFDPREGKPANFRKIIFDVVVNDKICYAAALSNQLYISNGIEYQMMDPRNNSTYIKIEKPISNECTKCLFSSYNKLYTVTGGSGIVYEYIDEPTKWKNLGSFKELSGVYNGISFEPIEPLDISEY